MGGGDSLIQKRMTHLHAAVLLNLKTQAVCIDWSKCQQWGFGGLTREAGDV